MFGMTPNPYRAAGLFVNDDGNSLATQRFAQDNPIQPAQEDPSNPVAGLKKAMMGRGQGPQPPLPGTQQLSGPMHGLQQYQPF